MTEPKLDGLKSFRLYTCEDGSYVFVTEAGTIGMEFKGHIAVRSPKEWLEAVWKESL